MGCFQLQKTFGLIVMTSLKALGRKLFFFFNSLLNPKLLPISIIALFYNYLSSFEFQTFLTGRSAYARRPDTSDWQSGVRRTKPVKQVLTRLHSDRSIDCQLRNETFVASSLRVAWLCLITNEGRALSRYYFQKTYNGAIKNLSAFAFEFLLKKCLA